MFCALLQIVSAQTLTGRHSLQDRNFGNSENSSSLVSRVFDCLGFLFLSSVFRSPPILSLSSFVVVIVVFVSFVQCFKIFGRSPERRGFVIQLTRESLVASFVAFRRHLRCLVPTEAIRVGLSTCRYSIYCLGA